MAKPALIEIRDFASGGMNTFKHPRELSPTEAVTSTGVDYSDGTLKGFYGLGTADKTGIAANQFWVHFLNLGANTWRTSVSREFACDDGTFVVGGASYGLSYYTDVAGSGGLLFSADSITNHAMGIASPAVPTQSGGSGGVVRSYRITHKARYTQLNITVESNPSPALNSANSTVTLAFAAAAADTTGITNSTAVYATDPGATGAGLLYYLIWEVAAGVTGYMDASQGHLLNGPAGVGNPTILAWDVNGVHSNAVYQQDHTPPPTAITILANTLLGVPAAPVVTVPGDSTRAGILLAGYGTTLCWSQSGNPWHWPVINQATLDDTIEAIVVDRGTAYVITQSGVYAVTGYDDWNLSTSKIAATHGCVPGGGTAAMRTPHGIVYPSYDGLAILDMTAYGTLGGVTRNITDGVMAIGFGAPTSTLTNLYMAAYQDEVYVFCDGQGHGYLVDFQTWPQIRVTKADFSTIVAMTTVRYAIGLTGGKTGLHVLDTSGNIKPWYPRQGALVSATKIVWTHTTGAFDLGDPTKANRFCRSWFAQNTASDVTLTFNCYSYTGTLIGTLSGITASSWLPATFTGDYLQVVIAATVGTDVFEGLSIEAEIL